MFRMYSLHKPGMLFSSAFKKICLGVRPKVCLSAHEGGDAIHQLQRLIAKLFAQQQYFRHLELFIRT